jgi:hypothetical protein|tara:strand:+ start:1389 stop:1727 length:339 start_codon:yes stop_codon:yes gene_type:complete
MTATSVTGIGLGAAKNQKGSEHMTLGQAHLVGPRVVAASDATLDGSGDLTVILPGFGGAAADYIVTATDADATAAAAVAASLAMDATSSTITLKGPASGVVVYSVIKKGLAI